MGIKSQRLQVERMDVVARFTMEFVLEAAANHRNLILQWILSLCSAPCANLWFWSSFHAQTPTSRDAKVFQGTSGIPQHQLSCS